jgi:F0F1-type ATP synthase delta subunit
MVRKIPWGKWWEIHLLEKWETANPNGRPKKSFRLINDELKAKGYEALTKSQLIEAYSLVFNTDEEELQRIAKDKNTPYALRIIILEMNNKNYRAKALQDYRDYMFWKALQQVQNETTVVDVSEELEASQKKKLAERFTKIYGSK